VETLRRREKDVLPPTVIAGVNYHERSRLNAYKREQESTKRKSETAAGDDAASAFELFDAGENAAAVVKALHLEPRVVRELHREWANMKGTIVIPREAIERFEDIAIIYDGTPIETGEQLVRLIAQLEDPECLGCKSRAPRFCVGCFVNRPGRARKRASELVAAVRAAQEARYAREVEKRAANGAAAVAAAGTTTTE
jgi:hypothetical protein